MNNNYGRIEGLISSSELPWASESIYSNFIAVLAKDTYKGSPTLH
jgi:hypothetical protein